MYLAHMAIHNSTMTCIFCDQQIELELMEDHVIAHALFFCKDVRCKRCQVIFTTPKHFFEHLIHDHKIKSPNLATFSSHVSEGQNQREMVLMAIFRSKYHEI